MHRHRRDQQPHKGREHDQRHDARLEQGKVIAHARLVARLLDRVFVGAEISHWQSVLAKCGTITLMANPSGER